MAGGFVIDGAELKERYLRAQLAGDRREAVRLLLEEAHGASTSTLYQVIQAAQDEIGRLWQRNLVSIAQEHMATAISQLALAAIYERATVPARLGKRVLVACVQGELHDLPARLAADALDLAGFDVQFLGANVPHDDLAKLLRDTQPDLIGLSVTMSFHVPALREAVSRCRTLSAAPIFVGGHAVQWAEGLARELGVVTCAPSTDALVSLARSLVGLEVAA
jgi:methanogenic corrinoid protein MtbC1